MAGQLLNISGRGQHRAMESILVVDDNHEILHIIKEYLEALQYQVHTVARGLDALEALRTGSYDVLLSDIVMPDISGLGLIKVARKQNPEIIIIAMTGHGKDVGDLARELGPDRYLEKPFTLTHLLEAIRSALHNYP
jgi:CheY-like chemotaxis protein